jgi:hypothetical protein
MKIKYQWERPVVGIIVVLLFVLFFKSLSWLDSLYQYCGVQDVGERAFLVLATYGLMILIGSGFRREE